MDMLSHCTCFENINHVEYSLLCLAFDLPTQEKCCIYSTLSVYLPSTYIVLKLKGNRVIRGCERICVESMPVQCIFWDMHFIQLCPLFPNLLDLRLQQTALLCMLSLIMSQDQAASRHHKRISDMHAETRYHITSEKSSPSFCNDATTAFAVPEVSALVRWCDSVTARL